MLLRSLPFFLACLVLPVLAAAQETSPVPFTVGPDGTVVFSFRAPEARDVRIVSWQLPRPADQAPDDGPPAVPMTRTSDGTWTFSWGPLPAGIHEYRYRVDGLHLRDPLVLDRSTINWSLVVVPSPGGPREPWETVPDHPRGTVHRHTYASSATGGERELVVYTPPGYETSPDQRYPVVFLLHGAGGEAGSWTSPVGRAQTILDNHVAGGGTPRILVMPDGHVRKDGQLLPRPEANAIFYDEFFEQIIPLAEKRYRIDPNPDTRAVAGLSMGGGHALALALRAPEHFAHVGVFSSGVGSGGQEAESFARLSALASRPSDARPTSFWLACGTGDFARDGAVRLADHLRSTGLPLTWNEDASGHTWAAWRDFLPRFLQHLDATTAHTGR